MNAVDRVLQRWRIRQAAPFVRDGASVLDIGCYDGALLEHLRPRVARAVGIDPLATPRQDIPVTILRGRMPGDARLEGDSFDCVTMLAVLEHFDDPAGVSEDCFRLLRPGGRVVLTVPHPAIDPLFALMVRLGIVEGIDFEGHHRYDVRGTQPMFARVGFDLVLERPFQLGLNYLFVFEKPGPDR